MVDFLVLATSEVVEEEDTEGERFMVEIDLHVKFVERLVTRLTSATSGLTKGIPDLHLIRGHLTIIHLLHQPILQLLIL